MFVQHMYWPDELEWLLDFSSAKQKVHSIICNISWSSGRSVQQPLWGTLQCPAWTCTHTSDGKWICTFSAWTKRRKFWSPVTQVWTDHRLYAALLAVSFDISYAITWLWRIELTISFVTGVPSLLLVLWLLFFVARDSDNPSEIHNAGLFRFTWTYLHVDSCCQSPIYIYFRKYHFWHSWQYPQRVAFRVTSTALFRMEHI